MGRWRRGGVVPPTRPGLLPPTEASQEGEFTDETCSTARTSARRSSALRRLIAEGSENRNGRVLPGPAASDREDSSAPNFGALLVVQDDDAPARYTLVRPREVKCWIARRVLSETIG